MNFTLFCIFAHTFSFSLIQFPFIQFLQHDFSPHKFTLQIYLSLLFQYTHATWAAPICPLKTIELYIIFFLSFNYINHGDLEKMTTHKYYFFGGVHFFFPKCDSSSNQPLMDLTNFFYQ